MVPSDKLQRAIKQTKPFGSLAEEAIVALIKTTDMVNAAEDQLFRHHQITMTQYNVLRILRGADERGLPCTEIGRRMLSRVPDVTRLIDRMEKQGLVERQRDTADRRVVHVRLSREGRNIVTALDKPVARHAAETMGRLKPEKLEQLLELLDEVRSAHGEE